MKKRLMSRRARFRDGSAFLLIHFWIIVGCADSTPDVDVHDAATEADNRDEAQQAPIDDERPAPPDAEQPASDHTGQGESAPADTSHTTALDADTEPTETITVDKKRQKATIGLDEKELVRAYAPNDAAAIPTKEMVHRRKAPVGAMARRRDDVDSPLSISVLDPRDIVHFCSGTLISPDLFLTAGHCCNGDSSLYHFEANEYVLASRDCNTAEIETSFVSFNYELEDQYDIAAFRQNMTLDDHLTGDRYAVEEVIEHSNIYYGSEGLYNTRFLDYMILRLAGRPGDKYGYTKLADSDVTSGQPLFAIQHPASTTTYLGCEPKQVGVGAATSDVFPPYDKDDEAYRCQLFLHNIDTFGGSSGSGILDAQTGELVGVHVAGEKNVANDAMPINYLVEHSNTLKTVQETVGFYDVWTQDDCPPQADAFCFNDDVYWYDGCGRPQSIKSDCEGRCIDAACYATEGDISWGGGPVQILAQDAATFISTIPVSKTGTVESAQLYVDIIHSDIHNLALTLICPSGNAQVLDTRSGIPNALQRGYLVTACNGEPADGDWQLVINGNESGQGRMNDWILNVQVDEADMGKQTTDASGDTGTVTELISGDTPIPIPDNDGDGIASTIPMDVSGTIGGVSVDVDITHTFIQDLRVVLACPSGTSIVLHNGSGGNVNDIHSTYEVTECNGQEMSGDWTLIASDLMYYDEGTLDGWALRVSHP